MWPWTENSENLFCGHLAVKDMFEPEKRIMGNENLLLCVSIKPLYILCFI